MKSKITTPLATALAAVVLSPIWLLALVVSWGMAAPILLGMGALLVLVAAVIAAPAWVPIALVWWWL